MGVSLESRLVLLLFITAKLEISTSAALTNNIQQQGGSPWGVPFGVLPQNQQSSSSSSDLSTREFFASSLVYDPETDRVYVTGVSHKRRVHSSDFSSDVPSSSPTSYSDDAQYDDDMAVYDNDSYNDDDYDATTTFTNSDSDCFMGILQVPRRSSNNVDSVVSILDAGTGSNDWIRQHARIGTRDSQEACSGIDIVRRGNDRKVFLIGHSISGPTVLKEHLHWYNSTHPLVHGSTSNSTTRIITNYTNATKTKESSTELKRPLVYGFVVDVTWYNGQVPTGYLMHRVPVEYPIGIKTSSQSTDEDIYVASIQSLSGTVNPAHNLYQMAKRQTDNSLSNASDTANYDTTTAGAYRPPEYGERFSFNLRRIGERTRSINDIMTLPKVFDEANNSTLSYQSKLDGSKFLNLLKLANRLKSQESPDGIVLNSSSIINGTIPKNGTQSSKQNVTNVTSNKTVTNTSNDVPLPYDTYRFVVEPLVERWGRTFSATKSSTTPAMSSAYTVQVSSLLHCTITTMEESTSQGDDDNTDDDSTTYVQRQQHMLVVAGSTRGSGLALGGDVGDTSLHGFVSSFDTVSGVLLRSRSIVANVAVSNHGSTGYTVRILGMCQPDSSLIEDFSSMYHTSKFVYIVGMTDGSLDQSTHSLESTHRVGVYEAFIQKIDVVTLEVKWTRQIGAAKFTNDTSSAAGGALFGSVHGVSCAVTPDGLQIYLGGTVVNGAALTVDKGKTFITTSFGNDDIFVAQYMASDGNLNFVKQIGTVHDDTIANGESLATDKYGNAILLGNTRGISGTTQTRSNVSNTVVLLSIERSTGNHLDFHADAQPSQTYEPPSGPQNAIPNTVASQQPTLGPTITTGDDISLSSWSDLSQVNVVYLLILSVLTAIIVLSVGLTLWTCRRRNRNEKLIARYLLSLSAEQRKNNKNDHQSCGNKDNNEDVERATLFANDTERTDSSHDDFYETVFFIPSQQYGGPPPVSLNDDGDTLGYRDNLLDFNRFNGQPNKHRKTNIQSSESAEANGHPLHRWMDRDP